VSFPATSWSCVIAARDGREREAHLDRLFRAYWQPVFLFIRRSWNKGDEEARDLAQEFFLRLLETDFLKDVAPEKGRFRSYLKACLRHFLLDANKLATAAKRGGGAKLFSIDATERPIEIPAATPEESFDLEWTQALIQAVLPAMEQSLKSLGRERAWKLFREVDLEGGGARPSYGELAKAHGETEQKVKSDLDFARKMLRKLILPKVRDYTVTDEDAAREMKELFPGE
jgi:RNA polymerase sigma-70 factor (ECF subfamily)